MQSERILTYRLRGNRITEAQEAALNAHWKKYGLENDVPIDLTRIFPSYKTKILEIGFGMGEATAILAAKNANVAVQPSSELVNIPGVDYVGSIPESLQLIQTFAAAIVVGSPHESEAKKLIDYLSSKNAIGPIKNGGMNPVR